MIKIICIGKLKENYVKELVSDYQERINKYHKIEIIELKDNDNIKVETKELLNVINKKEYNILLSLNGNVYDSIEFAKHIDNLFIQNSNITFIIGGSNGVEKEVEDIVNESISFSKFTFPHGLFRGILLEQIYRAFKINANENYHK